MYMYSLLAISYLCVVMETFFIFCRLALPPFALNCRQLPSQSMARRAYHGT